MRGKERAHARQKEFVIFVCLKEEITKRTEGQPGHQQDWAAQQICPQRQQGGGAGFHDQLEQAVRSPAEGRAVQDAEDHRCEQDASWKCHRISLRA